LHNQYNCSVRSLEVLAGNLASMHWAFGRISRLMTMSFYNDINRAPSRYSFIRLSDDTIHDLNFWLCGFNHYNGFKPIWQPMGFHLKVYTDAAGINLKNFGGWAGWTRTQSGTIKIAKGIWTEAMSKDHSTLQEIVAVFNTIKSFNLHGELANKRVLVKTDNQAVFFIINKAGSRDQFVHQVCKDLLWYTIHNNIDLHASWIPRDLNEFADFYSKHTDSGDYKLNPLVFHKLSKLWGPFDIDLFASFDNHLLPRYYSLYFTPDCLGVDAFNYNWGRQCFCNPPFSLIARAIHKGKECGARFCLIAPFTPTAIWWHLISSNGTHFAPYVRAFQILGRAHDLFLSGRMAHAYASHTPRWNSLALLIDFKRLLGPSALLRMPEV